MLAYVKRVLKKYNTLPIVAKATLWFLVANIIQKCISLLTTPIFTRLMTTEQYGQFTVYNSWLQIFTIVCSLRLNWSVFNKGMSKYRDARDEYTATMQTITFCMAVLLMGVYLLFRRQINALTELPTFVMLAMIVELMFAPAIDFWTVRKRYEYQYKPVVLRTLLLALLNSAIGVAAVLCFEEKGFARIISCVLVNLGFGISLFAYNLRRSKRIFVMEYAKYAIMFNLPLLLHYFSQYILDQFDKIMIQKMVSFGAAALYGVAYNAGMLMKIVTTSINQALIPWQYDKLEKNELRAVDDLLFAIFVIVGICAVMFSAVAPELMLLFAGEQYTEAMYVIPPVAVGMFFLFVYTSFANIEFFYEMNRFTMYISLAGAVLNVVLNYYGIALFGYVAAAYTTLICYVVFMFSHYLYMMHGIKAKTGVQHAFRTKRLAVLCAMITIAGIAIVFLYDYSLVRYLLIAGGIAAAFLKRREIMHMIKTIRKTEKQGKNEAKAE